MLRSILVKFIILLTFLAFNAKSSEFLDHTIIKTIKEINTGTLIPAVDQLCTKSLIYTDATPSMHTSALYNRCAIDLCGPVGKNQSVWITDSNFSSNISPEILKKVNALNPTIKKLYNIEKKNKLRELNSIKNLIKNKITIDDDDLDSVFKEQITKMIFARYFKTQIDINAQIDKRVKVITTPPQDASPEFISALKNYTNNLEKSFSSTPVSLNFERFYTDDEFNPLAIFNLNKFKQHFKSYQSNLTPDQKKNIETKIQEIELSLKNNKSSFNASVAITNILSLDEEISKNKKDQIFKEAVCDIDSCNNAFSEYLNSKNLQKNISIYEKKLNSSKTISKSTNRCKASLIAGEMESSNLAKSQEVYKKAKEAIINKVLPRYSEHSQKILLNYLEHRLISNNTNTQKLLESLLPTSDSFSTSAENFIQEASIPDQSEPDTQSLWEKVIVLDKSFDEIDPLDGVNLCGSESPTTVWDAFLPTEKTQQLTSEEDKAKVGLFGDKDNIFISDFSCEHADHGKHNTEHEIGHAINYLFSKNELSKLSIEDYNKMRKCASSNYTNAQRDETDMARSFDNIYTEEDTADLFSFIADDTEKEKNYSCAFLKASDSNNTYSKLDFIHLDDNDPHSSPFTRVISEALNKSIPLSDNCKRLIQQEKPSLRFKKCI